MRPGTGRVDRGGGEDARGDRAEHAADAVDREHVERVVDVDALAQERGAVAQAAGDEADGERAARRHEAGRRGDGHEAGDGTRRRAHDADLPLVEVAGEHPRDRRGRGRCVGDQEGVGGEAVGAQGGAGVEAEPAEPQEARAEDGHRDVVGLDTLAVEHAAPDQDGDEQGRHARGGVDDGAAGEVEGAQLVQPAVGGPDPVRHGGVDEHRPQDGEQHERAEALALGERARDQGRRDGREHQLEGGEQDERDRRAVGRVGRETDGDEARRTGSGLPMRPSPPTSVPNASEKPTTTQTMLTRARPKKLCMIVDRTFLRRTRPP